ncbi:ATP-binding cassette domain-containing protein [Amaricoccus tamworthensis]|uniref:ATP-binding cassette domain-containing protein n=1 Tax=Amaricoccus tamworthensis TaxID=57002 RepID=UPI003C7DE4EB
MQNSDSRSDPRTVSQVRSAISPHLLWALIFSALVNMLFLASPLYMMQLYGRVLDSRSIETLVALSVALLLALVAMAAADAARGRILVRAASRLEGRFAGVGPAGTTGHADRMTDLVTLRTFLAGSAATTLFDAPFTVLFLCVLFMLHPVLGLVATLGAAIILAAVTIARFLSRERDRRIQAGQSGLDDLSAVLDRDRGDLRALGAERGLTARLLGGLSETGGLRQQNGEQSASLGAFNRMVRMGAHSGALATGAVLTLNGELAPAAMLAAAILAGRALGPMESLPGALRQAGAARRALGRLASSGKDSTRLAAPSVAGEGAAVNLSRALVLPKGATRPALRGVSLDFAPGEVVSVTGSTGSGKSTLGRVIVGIEPLRGGQIRVAGEDPAGMDMPAGLIGWMPQDATLYPGTVAENIGRFCDVPQAEILAAAERAGAREAIERLPQGFATVVGAGGLDPSPGIRQPIALARALLGKPALVVLDQPTAHMDAAGEVATLNAIRALKEAGTTVIVISHKPVLAALADKILVLRDGAVELFEARETVIGAMRNQSLSSVSSSGKPAKTVTRPMEAVQ